MTRRPAGRGDDTLRQARALMVGLDELVAPRRRGRRRPPRSVALVAVLVVVAIVVLLVPRLLGGAGGTWPGGDAGAGGSAVPAEVPDGSERATVERVVDGDTVIVDLDGERERLRLIGVDTTETVAPGRPVDCFGPEASAWTTEALPAGATVWLEADPTQGERDEDHDDDHHGDDDEHGHHGGSSGRVPRAYRAERPLSPRGSRRAGPAA